MYVEMVFAQPSLHGAASYMSFIIAERLLSFYQVHDTQIFFKNINHKILKLLKCLKKMTLPLSSTFIRLWMELQQDATYSLAQI